MSTEPSPRDPARKPARGRFLVVGLIGLSLLLSGLAPVAAAVGQPTVGFCERDCSERFWVMASDWTVRTDLAFASTETVRVNVSSIRVDWQANAGGGGAMDLDLQRYDGTVLWSESFAQVATGAVSLYTASIDLSLPAPAADWYYLRIFIDDTQTTFEAMSAIRVGAANSPHLIETYSDDTFSDASDVFTTSSRIWVRAVGNAGEDPDRWDLYEFIDASSMVNGPLDVFDDFSRNGNVYTFSIDLAQFPGSLFTWWSYTLSVRFTGSAFDAGKQIQIYDPGLTIASQNLAPAQGRQGETDVPMLALTLSLPGGFSNDFGPAAFNLERLRFARTGVPGTNADVSVIRIYEDVNGNWTLDGPDVLLASRVAAGGLPFPAWVGQNGVTMTTVVSSGPRRLLVAMDVAPNAGVGNFAGLRINGPADVDMHGHFPSILGLPAQSGNVQIAGADVLAVTNDPGIAPGTAAQGQADVPVDLLTLSTNGATITVDAISVELRGTASSADVTWVFLRVDDGDGVYEPAVDAALGSPTNFPTAGPAVFSALGFAVDSTPRDVWIVIDAAATATIGAEAGTRIVSDASIVATGGSVYGGNFPLDSGLVRIRGPLLTIIATNLAPVDVPVGRLNVAMLRLNLSVDFGTATVLGMRVDKGGSSPVDSDLASVRLYADVDADGVWTSADSLLAATIFVGGTAVFAPLGIDVASGEPVDLFLVIDVATSATPGDTVRLEIQDEAWIAANADATVSPAPFAIASRDVLLTVQTLGAVSGIVTDAAGRPLVGATVVLAGTGLSTTTDVRGAYAFQDLPLGTYFVVANRAGFAGVNRSATLTAAAPSAVVDFSLAAQIGMDTSLLLIGGAILLALIALAGLMLLAYRRKARCPVCGKPKPRDRPVCAECEAKGLGPTVQGGPPPPPPPP